MTIRALIWTIILGILVGSLFGIACFPPHVGAAPLHPINAVCRPGEFNQEDMAGQYEVRYMLVEIYPCGGVVVSWINDYGEHVSVYFSDTRIPSGGVFMAGYQPDPEMGAYLDGVPYAVITPAEPGWIKLTTITPKGDIHRSYRLAKRY